MHCLPRAGVNGEDAGHPGQSEDAPRLLAGRGQIDDDPHVTGRSPGRRGLCGRVIDGST
jgi:hypothetical protein